MRIQCVYHVVAVCAAGGFVTSDVAAASLSFEGTMSTDDQVVILSFVAGPGSVIIQSWGYAGSGVGTNANGQTISPGGFDSFFSLFGPGLTLQPSTVLLTTNDNGGFNVLADPVTGQPFDSYIDTSAIPLTLTAGATYFLLLTEAPNSPMSGSYGGGFSGDGQGNYTGAIYGCGSGPFCDITGTSRTGNWAVDITGVASAQDLTAVPEPGSLALFGYGMAGFMAARRKRKHRPSGGRVFGGRFKAKESNR